MAKHSKINLFTGKLVYLIFTIIWKIENIFYLISDPRQTTFLMIMADKQRIASDLLKISCSLDSCVQFWTRHSHDEEAGWEVNQPRAGSANYLQLICIFRGFLNCLSADGSVYDTTKYCWLQGRWDRTKIYLGGILNWWKCMIGVWYKFQASLLIWFNEKIITICAENWWTWFYFILRNLWN